MTDRSVVYRLKADVSQFKAQMAAASASVKDAASKMTAADKDGQKFRKGLDTVGSAAGKVGLVAAAGLGAAVLASANFDQGMSNVQAATHETASNMELLRAAALKAGADTAFSATEAAAGIEELAKAGVSTTDVLGGGLAGALDLAAAGGISVSEAAETAASALTQFKLSGEDVPHVADLLAAAAGKAQGSVTDMGYALKYAGVPAHALGVSIEETTGVIAEFASAGIIGEQAGTTLRGILVSLSTASGPAQKAMDKVGLSFYDANGKFIGLSAAAQELHDKLGNLTDAERNNALVKIFGRESLQGAITLYEGGAQAVENWTNKVDDSGYATETASTKLNNLKGDLEALKGSLETALIGTGDGSTGVLRGLTQGLTDVINAYNRLPGAAQSAVGGTLAATAALGGGVFFGAKTVQGIANTRTALDQLGLSGTRTKGVLIGLGKAVGAFAGYELAITGIGALQSAFDDTLPTVQELTRQLIHLQGATDVASLSSQFDDLGASIDRMTDKGVEKKFTDFVVSVGSLGQLDASDLRSAKRDIEALDAALTNLVASGGADRAKQAFADMAQAQGLSKGQTDRLLTVLPGYRDALAGTANNAELAASGADSLAGAAQGSAGAMKQSAQAANAEAKALANVIDAMRKQRSARLAALNAEIGYQAALDDARASLKQNGKTLDITTAKGRANKTALLGVAAAWNEQSDAAKNAPGAHRAAINSFVRLATSMGMNIEKARALARRILEVPSRNVRLGVDTGAAAANVRGLRQLMDSLHDKTVTITTRGVHVGGGTPSGGTILRAEGGPIYGPGTATSDSIPVMASNGEFMMRAAAVQKYGLRTMQEMNAMRLARGGLVGRSAPAAVASTTGPMVLTGILDTPFGPAQVRGVVREEVDSLRQQEMRRAYSERG